MLFVLIIERYFFELATAQIVARIEQLTGDGVPPTTAVRLMTPTGRLASVGACPLQLHQAVNLPARSTRPRRLVVCGLVRRRRFASAVDKSRLHSFRFQRSRVTAMFAYVFEASQEQCATLLILGILTAVAEYVFRSRSERLP